LLRFRISARLKRGVDASTFLGGYCVKRGRRLLNVLAATFGALDLFRVVLFQGEDEFKTLVAIIAEVIVDWHGSLPLARKGNLYPNILTRLPCQGADFRLVGQYDFHSPNLNLPCSPAIITLCASSGDTKNVTTRGALVRGGYFHILNHSAGLTLLSRK